MERHYTHSDECDVSRDDTRTWRSRVENRQQKLCLGLIRVESRLTTLVITWFLHDCWATPKLLLGTLLLFGLGIVVGRSW